MCNERRQTAARCFKLRRIYSALTSRSFGRRRASAASTGAPVLDRRAGHRHGVDRAGKPWQNGVGWAGISVESTLHDLQIQAAEEAQKAD